MKVCSVGEASFRGSIPPHTLKSWTGRYEQGREHPTLLDGPKWTLREPIIPLLLNRRVIMPPRHPTNCDKLFFQNQSGCLASSTGSDGVRMEGNLTKVMSIPRGRTGELPWWASG